MVVRELAQPSRAEWMQVTDVLNDSFWRTPLFKDFLFRGRKALSRTFIKALLLYSLKTGRVFVAEEGERRIVAVALLSLPNSPELGLGTYLRTGMWPYMLSIALRSPLAMGRIGELFAFLEIHAPEFPCHTLEFLASAQKGAGAALLRECIPHFEEYPLYVESIVSKNDHAFYRQFGFEPYARADFHGTDYAFALIQRACATEE